jgi:hypothetical protein
MSILWCGGEDIDFPNGFAVQSFTVDPLGNFAVIFRPAYARCSIWPAASFTICKSTAFGPVTSAWLAFQLWAFNFGQGTVNNNLIGLGLSGTDSALFLGAVSTAGMLSGGQLALMKSVNSVQGGGPITQLAVEPGSSLPNSTLVRIDMQVINFGALCTVNVWLNGALLFTFTGDVTLPGMAAFDSVFLSRVPSISGESFGVSEIIVADEDTRAMSLQTLAPAGAGTTENWTGAYTDINEVVINDATVVTTNTPALDWQATLPALVAGAPGVRGVKIAARASTPAGSVATTVGLGVNSGGTINAGAQQSPTVPWETLERFMVYNPTTGQPWTTAQMNALQLNLRSGA